MEQQPNPVERPEPIRTGRSSEAAHWYAMDGAPCYEIERAKLGPAGETHRSVTLADAKKMVLLGSYSTIASTKRKPGLENWIIGQAIQEALTSPHFEKYSAGLMSEDDFLASIEAGRKATASAAAEEGTRIHEAIERRVRGESYPAAYERIVRAVDSVILEIDRTVNGPERTLVEALRDCTAEITFACPQLGYGGRIDLTGKGWLSDVKTQEFNCLEKPPRRKKNEPEPEVKPKVPNYYDDFAGQLVAYDWALQTGGPTHDPSEPRRLFSIVVSRTHHGLVGHREWDKDEKRRALETFDLLRRYWLIETGMAKVLASHLGADPSPSSAASYIFPEDGQP